MVPSRGGKRRKYGGTTTRHGFRKGDYVHATQGEKTFFGRVSGLGLIASQRASSSFC